MPYFSRIILYFRMLYSSLYVFLLFLESMSSLTMPYAIATHCSLRCLLGICIPNDLHLGLCSFWKFITEVYALIPSLNSLSQVAIVI